MNKKLFSLLSTSFWPDAVDSSLICNKDSNDDLFGRAQGILEFLIDIPINNLKFLDFGTGDGHVAVQAMNYGAISMGYDIAKGKLWADYPNMFTNSLELVNNVGPYDIIFLYDVLDHVYDVESIMNLIKNLSKPETLIYIRCHPWCSRHGGHLYEKLNKAFIHVIMTEEELNYLGLNHDFINKILYPLDTYKNWFSDFSIIEKNVSKQEVDSFFFENELIFKRFNFIYNNKFINHKHHLENNFIDFKLCIKKR